MTLRIALALLLLTLISARSWAQEDPAPVPAADPPTTPAADEPKQPETTTPETPAAPSQPAEPADEKPAAAKPADEKPAAKDPAPAAGDALARYEALFAEWKELIGQLRDIQSQYKVAKPDDRKAMEAQYNALLDKGDAMYPQLRSAAEAAYAAHPDNADLAEFMGYVCNSDLRNDRFEDALRTAEFLIEKNYPNKRVYDIAGRAAFNSNQFDKAEKYLKQAAENSAIDPEGERLLSQISQVKDNWRKEAKLRAAEAEADDLPRVLIKTTKGDVVIELFENEAPNSVANFISLVKKKFYNDTPFHRVLPGFMAQGGDPTGTGTGGPGYQIACECYDENHRQHFRGSLSMAHSGRDTGGSQFFLTFVPTTHLDGRHTVFGRVIEGFDVLDKLQRRDPNYPPLPNPDKIVEATVVRDRGHEYEVKKVADEN